MKTAKNLPANNTPAPPVTEQPAMSEMEQLKMLLAKFGKADIAKLVKEVNADKHTVLSVTMDAIVEAGDVLVSATINERATALGRECGVFNASEAASPVSTAQLIRHVTAYEAAIKRAVAKVPSVPEENAEETPVLDVDQFNQGEPSYTEQPAA